MTLNDEELERLFSRRKQRSEKWLKEDLGILQPDGTRACAEYELEGRGFHLVNIDEDPYSVL